MKNDRALWNGRLSAAVITLFAVRFILAVCSVSESRAQTLTLVSHESLPSAGTFHLASSPDTPPFPFFPYAGLDIQVYSIEGSPNTFFVDDAEWAELQSQMEESGEIPPPVEGEGESGGGSGEAGEGFNYSTNDIWLELKGITNDFAYLTLHNPSQHFWQLQSKTDLAATEWELGQIIDLRTASVTETNFVPVYTGHQPIRFYRAQGADHVVFLSGGGNATEPDVTNSFGSSSSIYVNRLSSSASNLTVFYRMSGLAAYGVDYTNYPGPVSSNLIGSTTIQAGLADESVIVEPLYDGVFELDEQAQLTLLQTNGYLIDPSRSVVWVTIEDNPATNMFSTVATNVVRPVGIDYSPVLQSLLVSVNYNPDQPTLSGLPYNFARIDTNGVVSRWSGVSNLVEEIKLATVKTTTNGFTQGEMYFGNGTNGQIGKLSADGSVSNITWAVLTTNITTFETLLRGGLYIDEGGSFGGDLIAVTGAATDQGGGVWRINSSGNATRLASITNNAFPHLEGVITLTNDVAKWGPWAGKIITGAESKIPPLIHAIDTNGVVTTFDLGIAPEDFDLIPTNQDLYCTDQIEHRLVRLPSSLFTNYWGDLLITQAGEAGFSPKLFIVRWAGSNFETRSISYTNAFEHVTFAPIKLPTIPGL